ncbi:MAG: Heterodimeric efflux ABC transporter, permease/ATP-binding subunit 2 [uncultured Thermomicrobiales bacterium]|uniref:Heterodimeric efflux ABC transporter, permease/ATP-binding subunit 2 n=1 Tax=uncultured Thermomicrobiales bacterium TaxID=1645740 RepID=A0A6J4UTT2_9BACT|nr:MAG: Heterodimeric efflux ABC transporter, permease/ATP-binding subunit 2 [uncultured Thermomicrobiales bacterium]
MGFFMDGLEAEDYDRKYRDGELVGRIVAYFRRHRRVMGIVALFAFSASVLSALIPFLIYRTIDRIDAERVGGGSVDFRDVLPVIVALFLSGILVWVLNYVRQWLSARVVGDVILDIRKDAFRAVMKRDLSFFDQYPSGKIVSRVTSDTESFASVATLTLDLLSQILMVLVLAAVLFFVNPLLATIAFAITPLIALVALAFRRIARRTIQQAQRSTARLNSMVQESMTGISVAKSFRRERALYEEFREANEQSYRINLREGFVFTSIFPILITISGIGTVTILLVGGNQVLDGRTSVGEWFLFIQAIGIFWGPITSIASFWSQFQLGLAASERVFALIDAEAVVQQTAEEPAPVLRGGIAFRDMVFRYSEQELVFDGLSFDIPAGQTVAFVGHTGAGKSSIGKLLARFYEFQGGQILVDGHDIRRFDLPSYRRQLGVVTQVPFLFSGTVADNIRYSRPDATDEHVQEIANRIAGGDWLTVLPEGLQTDVGEEGRSLSLGQRQLVALARLLMQDPAVVILDEATASVDPLTEAQIQEALDVALADRTAIVIAHRLSTIQEADRIIVLDRGRIIEDGTHDGLLAAGGHYSHLFNTYFRHQSPDYRPGQAAEAERDLELAGAASR